jgi:hypothetical protein
MLWKSFMLKIRAVIMMPWLDYFLKGMAVVFERVAQEVERRAGGQDEDVVLKLLRPLDHLARRVLGLFAQQDLIVSSNVANLLGISVRQARDLLTGWVKQGWIETAYPSRRGRKYRLADRYHNLLEQPFKGPPRALHELVLSR